MQSIDRLTQFRDASGVQKHVIRYPQARGAARLRGENRASLLDRAAVSCLQSLYLQHFVRIDHQDAIYALSGGAALDEQGYGHDYIRPLR